MKLFFLLPILFFTCSLTSAQKRIICTVETDPIKLVNCNYEDEEDMVEGGFELSVPEKWKPALSLAMHGEGTAHIIETGKGICLRQMRPLDGFVQHPANQDLNLCQPKGKRRKR